MSAGISGSYTVLSAATMSAVSCSSSSGGIDEPGRGVAATGVGAAVASGVSAVLVSIGRLHTAARCVGWVKRSADPTPAETATCVGSSLTLDPTYEDGHPKKS